MLWVGIVVFKTEADLNAFCGRQVKVFHKGKLVRYVKDLQVPPKVKESSSRAFSRLSEKANVNTFKRMPKHVNGITKDRV